MIGSDWDATNGFSPENEVDVPRKRVTTAIRFKPHLHDALSEHAARQERSINWLVNAPVAAYVSVPLAEVDTSCDGDYFIGGHCGNPHCTSRHLS